MICSRSTNHNTEGRQAVLQLGVVSVLMVQETLYGKKSRILKP